MTCVYIDRNAKDRDEFPVFFEPNAQTKKETYGRQLDSRSVLGP